jgi:hypothetical protein
MKKLSPLVSALGLCLCVTPQRLRCLEYLLELISLWHFGQIGMVHAPSVRLLHISGLGVANQSGDDEHVSLSITQS